MNYGFNKTSRDIHYRLLWVESKTEAGIDLYVPFPVIISLCEVLEIVGDYDRAIRLLEACQKKLDTKHISEICRIYLQKARYFWLTNTHHLSIENAEAVLALARDSRDRISEAKSLQYLGKVENDRGGFSRAYDLLYMALQIAEDLADADLISSICNDLGVSLWELGKYEEALVFYNRALDIKRTAGDFRDMAIIMNNIALIHWTKGELKPAESYFRKCLDVFRRIGERPNCAIVLNNLGGIYHDMGEDESALEFHFKSQKENRLIGNLRGEGNTHQNLGIIYSCRKNYKLAEEHFFEAIECFKSSGDQPGISMAMNSLGIIYCEQCRWDESRKYLLESLRIKRELGHRLYEAGTLINLSNLEWDTGEEQLAWDYYYQAERVYRELGLLNKMKELQAFLAQIYFYQTDYPKAVDNWRVAMEDTVDGDADSELPAWLAQALARIDRRTEALDLLLRYKASLFSQDNSRFRLALAAAELLDAGADASVIHSIIGCQTVEECCRRAEEIQVKTGEPRQLLDLLCTECRHLFLSGKMEDGQKMREKIKEISSATGLKRYIAYIEKLCPPCSS